MRKYAGVFSVVMGVGMLAMWAMFFATGQVPELRTAPVALAFHVVAEFATALLLMVSGLGVLTSRTWGRSTALVALGMLFYTVIVSPGYFAQLGQWPLVVMFAAFGAAGLAALAATVRMPADTAS